jgi:hypothetical protein
MIFQTQDAHLFLRCVSTTHGCSIPHIRMYLYSTIEGVVKSAYHKSMATSCRYAISRMDTKQYRCNTASHTFGFQQFSMWFKELLSK